MAILRSWFNGRKDVDVSDPDVDELFGRSRDLVKACATGIHLRLEIELDGGEVLRMPEIVEALAERASEIKDRPRRR